MFNKNKKYVCLFLIIFVTLMTCCVVAADSTNKQTNTNKEVTVKKTVQKIESNHIKKSSLKSTSNSITKTTNKNTVKSITTTKSQKTNNYTNESDEKTKIKNETKINTISKDKTKNKTVKMGTTGTPVSSWSQIGSSGTYYLTQNITANGAKTVSSITIDGNGFTISSTNGAHDLFTASGTVKLTDIVFRNVNGYIISGNYGHELTACEVYGGRVYKLTADADNQNLVTLTNCYFNSLEANAFDSDIGGALSNKYLVYNSIFENCTYPIFPIFNKGVFEGYNFIIQDHVASKARDVSGSGTPPLLLHGGQSTVSIEGISSNTAIVITAPNVHVNQTNNVTARLTAVVNGKTVGVPREDVTITITDKNGGVETLPGFTDSYGRIYRTNIDGKTVIPIVSTECGLVNIAVSYGGSSWVTNDNQPLYRSSTATGQYQVLGIPTTVTTSFNESQITYHDNVTIYANVDNNDNNSVKVNEGSVDFYCEGEYIGTANVINGVATLENVQINITGIRQSNSAITNGAVRFNTTYSGGSHYNMNKSSNVTLTVYKSDGIVITAPEAIYRYVGDYLNLWINVTDANGENITTISYNKNFTIHDTRSDWEGVRFYAFGNSNYYYTNGAINGTAVLGNRTNVKIKAEIPTQYPVTYPQGYYYAFKINSKYLGDLYYLPNNQDAITTVYVMKLPTVTTIANTSGYVTGEIGTPVTLTATVTDTYNNIVVKEGTVTFRNSTDILGTANVNSMGIASLNVTFNKPFNDEEITATFVGADYANGATRKYEDSSATTHLNITKIPTVTEVFTGQATNELNVVFRVTNETGNVIRTGLLNVYVNGTLIDAIDLSSGLTPSVDYEGYFSKTYTGPYLYSMGIDDQHFLGSKLVAEYVENDVYLNSSANVDIGEVFSHVSLSVVVNESSIYVDGSVNITVTAVNEDGYPVKYGMICIKVGDYEYPPFILDDSGNSVRSVIYSNVTPGNYSVTANISCVLYHPVVNSTSFNINLIPTITTVNAVSGSVGAVTNVKATVVAGNGMVVNQGIVRFYCGEQELGSANVANGNASIDVQFNGTIVDGRITATYVDNSDVVLFNNSSSNNVVDSGVTNIAPGTAHISMQEEYSGYYDDEIIITVNVTDINSGKNITSGSIIFKQGTETLSTQELDANGQASLVYHITGDSKVEITAELINTNYTATSNSTNVTKLLKESTLTIFDVPNNVKVFEQFTFKIKLNTSNGMGLGGKTVTVKVNNETIPVTQTNNDGVITVTYTPKNNNSIIINATFEGDIAYAASNATDSSLTSEHISLIGTNIIVESPESVTIGDTVTVTVKLLNDTEGLINPENVTLSITLNGVEITPVTNSTTNNIITITYITTRHGDLNITANYAGLDGIYSESIEAKNSTLINPKTATLNVDLGNLVATNTSDIVITVPEDTTDVLNGETVYINVTETGAGGTTHILTGTFVDGQAVISITPTISGGVTFNAVLPDNNIYGVLESTGNSNVELMPVTLQIVSDDDIMVGNNLGVTVNVVDANGNIINNLPVNIRVHTDGVYDNVNSGATVNYWINDKGNLNSENNNGNVSITADYVGSNVYAQATQATKTVITHGINTTIIPENDNQKIKLNQTNTFKIKVVETDNPTNPIRTGTVTITVVNATGDSILTSSDTQPDINGYVYYSFNPATTSTITVTAIYDNGTYYNGNISTQTFSLENSNFEFVTPIIELTATNTAVNQTNTITVTLKDGENLIKYQDVIVTIDSSSNTYNTGDTGIITITNYKSEIGRQNVVVTAQYAGNNTLAYNAAIDNQTMFNVSQIGTTLEFVSIPDNFKVGTTATITVSLKAANGTEINGENVDLYIGNTKVTTNSTVNGIVTFIYTPVNNDTLTFKAIYQEESNESYNSSETTEIIRTVSIIDTTMGVEYPATVNVTKPVTIVINLTDEYNNGLNTSNITVKVDGHVITTGKTFSDDGKTLTITYPTTKDETLTFDVEYPGVEGIYKETSQRFTVNVVKIPTTTVVTIINNTAGNVKINVSVKGEDGVDVTDGNITVTANGLQYNPVALNGQKEITIPLTNLVTYGNFTIFVQYSGNNTYKLSNAVDITPIEVIPQNITFTVTANESVYVTEIVNITGVIKDGFGEPIKNRDVIVRVIDENGNIDPETVTTDENGVYTRLYTTTKIGVFNVTVYYGGQDGIRNTTCQTNFTVNLIPTKTVVGVNNNTSGFFKISVNVTDNREDYENTPVDRGIIKVVINGDENNPVYHTITSNESIITLDSITTNATTNILVTYESNEKYNSSSADAFDVNARVKETYLILYAPESTPYNQTITINGTLICECGRGVYNAELPIVFNDSYVYTQKVIVDENGNFNFSFPASYVGNFEVNASFGGYFGMANPSNGSTIFTVTKVVTDTEVLITSESPSALRVLLRVYNGTSEVKYGRVSLIVGETTINVTDLSDSNLHMDYNGNNYVVKDFTEEYLESLGITAGVNSIKAIYAENEYFLDSQNEYIGSVSDNALIKVSTNQSSIYVDGSINITVNVTDSNGNPIRGRLTLKINENTTENIIISEGDNGIYSIIYSNTTADHYDITATLQSAIYATVSNSTSFNITKIPTKTNVSVHNNSWGNASIDVVVYDVRTDTIINTGSLHYLIGNVGQDEGDKEVTSSITNIEVPTKYAGEFAVTVIYQENPTYLSSTGVEDGTGDAFVINIRKHDAFINVTTDKDVYFVGENVKISGYLYDLDTGLPITGQTVNIVVKNSTNLVVLGTFTPITDNNGYYEVNRTTTSSGTFIVNATFEGTTIASESNINAANNSTTFTINRIPTTTTVQTLNDTYGNITISVNVKGNDGLNITEGTLSIKFGNEVLNAQITGNETVIKLPSIGIDTYDLNVSYPGNDKYVESNNTAGVTNINVQKQYATITVIANPTQVIVGESVKISGYVYDGMNNQTNLINGVVNITFVDENGNPETEYDVPLIGSYYEFTRSTKYAGIINVTVAYINDTYYNSTAKTSYTVDKIPTNTTVSIYNDTYGMVELAVTIVDARNGNPITTGHYNISINDDGQYNLIFGQDNRWVNATTFIIPVDTTNRDIIVTLNYTGNSTHESSVGVDGNGITPIEIHSVNQTATLTIEVDSTETYVGETLRVNGTLVDGLGHKINGKINLTFTNGTETYTIEENVVDGRYTHLKTVNMTGTVNVTASYLGDGDYINPVNATANYTIDKIPTSVTITVVNNTVGNLTISVQVNDTFHKVVLEEGNITIDYGTAVINDAMLNGTITLFNIPSTSQAPLTITVNFTGNNTHNFSTNTISTGQLVKQVPSLTISANETAQVDQIVTINGTLTNGMGEKYKDKEIIIKVYNSTGSQVAELSAHTNVDGNYTANYAPNKNGTYTAVASYIGDDVVAGITREEFQIVVDKVHTITNVTILNNTAGNVTIKVKVTDEQGNAITSGELNVTVDGVTNLKTFTDVNEYIFKLDGIQTNGTHTVSVEYLGTADKYYSSKGNISTEEGSEELTHIDAALQQSTITIDKDKNILYIGDNITIYGRLLDGMEQPISGAYVILTFVDESGSIRFESFNVTDSNGYYYYHRTTEYIGTINVTVTYDGQENKINASSANITYTVNRIPTNTYINTLNNTLGNVTIETWVTNQFDVTEYIREGTLYVYINNAQQPAETLPISTLTPNENGRYTIKLDENYNDGENTIRVVYSGTNTYVGSQAEKSGKLYKDDVEINITLDKDTEFVTKDINAIVSLIHDGNSLPGKLNITIINSTGDVVRVISTEEYLENGNKTFTFTEVTGDEYTIKVEYGGSEIYNALKATKTFTLNNLPTETLVDVLSNVINNVTINVVVNDTENNEIIKTGYLHVTVDGNSLELIPVNTTGETIIKLDTTGSNVLVTVRYIENNQYGPSLGLNSSSLEEFTNITLSKQPTRITIVANPNETYIGTPITITGNLINPLGDVNNQLIRIVINEKSYEVRTSDDDTGSYTFTYDGETSIANGNGTFTVSVIYDPTNNPVANASDNSTTIKVDKIPTNTSIVIMNNTVGNVTVNVKVVNAVNGESVTMGNVEFYNQNNELIGSYPITQEENIIKLGNITDSGNIAVTAKYIENNIYLGSDVKLDDDKTQLLENITVRNQTATIMIDINQTTVTIGESVTINGTLVDGMGENIDGTNIVDIRIDNDVYHVNVTNGKFSLVNITYTQGVKKVNATYVGSNTIDSVVSTTKEFTVNLIPTKSTVGIVNTTVGSVVINVNVTNVTGDYVTTGELLIKVGNNESRIISVNSTGITFIPLTEIIAMDNVTVTVTYLANEVYNSSIAVDVETLDHLEPNPYVDINTTRHYSIMEVNVVEPPVKVGQNITITGNLVIDNGTTVDNGTTGENEIVQIWMGNSNVGNATVKEGHFEFNYTTNQVTEGATATIIYDGTELVRGSEGTVNFVVEKLPTITIINVLNNTAGNVTLNISINDSFNNKELNYVDENNLGVGYLFVYIGEDLKQVEILHNENIIHLNDELTIPQPGVSVTVAFVPNENINYLGSQSNTVFNVVTQVANLTIEATPNPASVGEAVTITGRLVDGMNNNISNVELSWNIGSSSDKTITDENGIYSFTYVPTREGVYDVNVSYAGGISVSPIKATIPLIVNKIPTNTTVEVINTTVENVTIRVTVTDNDTQAITSGQFNVTLFNSTWTKTTTVDITGISTDVNLNITTADSDFTVKVVYLGDNKYINSTGRDNQEREEIPIHTVKQNATLTIVANPTEAYVGRTIEFTIDLKCGMGHGITDNVTLNITSEFGSEIIYPVQVTDGTVVYSRISQIVGQVNVTVMYVGNGTINPLNSSTTYTILKIPTTTTLVSVVNNTLGNLTIEIRFADTHTGNAITSGSNFTVELLGKEEESRVTYNLDNDASDDRFNITATGSIILKVDESHFDNEEEIGIVTFLGNGTYNSSWTRASEEVERSPVTIELNINDTVYINQTVTFNVTVKDSQGVPFEAVVNITVNGETFRTDETIPVTGKTFTFSKEISGNYTVEVTYPGTKLLSNATANKTVIIDRIPTDTKVTLLNNTFGNVTIKVTVNDTVYNKLISEGTLIITGGAPCNVTLIGTETIITLNITNIRPTNVFVKFNGTESYQLSYGFDTATDEEFEIIDVVKQDATLTVDVTPNPNHVGNETIIRGKLVDGMGNNITGEVVNILINNVTYQSDVNLDEYGEFSIPYIGSVNGTYNITVEFGGNRYVNPITVNKTLTLNKVDTTTTVTVLNNTAGNVTIRVNVTDEFENPVTTDTFIVNITQSDDTITQLIIPINGDVTDVLLPIDSEGDFKINVTYVGTDKYSSSNGIEDTTSEQFKNITVVKQNVTLTVNAVDSEVFHGSNIFIEGTLTNATGLPIANVNITLTFNGQDEVNVTTNTAGYYSYTRTALFNGNVMVVAFYAGDDKYNNSSKDDTYIVNKIPTNTTVSIVNNTVCNVTIDVQVKDANNPLVIITNGTVNVTVNNVTTQHNLTGSVTNIKLNITNCTKANVTVVYIGNDTYANSTGMDRNTIESDNPQEFKEVTADKQNATLTIVEGPSPVYVLNNVTYNGTLVDGLGNNITGKINITVMFGDELVERKTVDVINGVYNWTRTSIKVGQINVTASYLGNGTINQINASTSYLVNLRPTVTLVNITNNTAGNVTIDVQVMDVNGTILTDGNFTVKVQNHPDAIVKINGTITPVNLNITSASQYIAVSVIYNGNETYATSTGLDMDKFLDEPSVNETVTNITVDYQTPIMTIDSIANSSVGDTITITGHIEDGMGNNIVNRNITVTIGEIELSNITDTNGNFTVYFTSTINGTFTAIANYKGNNSVQPISVETSFNVTKLNTTTIVKVLNNTVGNVTITVNVTDERGNPVDHGEFNITIDETEPINYVIVGDITTVHINVEENGTISVNVTYLGDNQYESSRGQTHDETTGELVDFTEITTIKQDVNLTVGITQNEIPIGKTIEISGYLLNASDMPIANAKINLTFADVDSVIVYTDSNGRYTYERNTTIAGEVKVKAYFNGTSKYNNATDYTTYTVYKLPTNTTVRVINNTAGNVLIDVVVYDMYHNGIKIANGTLNVTVNNVTQIIDFTQENTTIKLDIQNDTKANVTVIYLGNNTYLNSTGITIASWNTDNPTEFTEITADKQNATITLNVTPETLTVFDEVKFNGTLVDGLGKNIADKVNITIDNGTDSYTYIDVPVDGYYEQIRTTNITGTVNVTVSYGGNNSVNPLNITKTYNVGKRDTTTLVQVVNDTIGNLTIDVVVKDALTGEVLTSGENLIAVTISEGTYPYSINESGVLRIKVQVSDNRQVVGINVDYLGNGTYNPSRGYNNATYSETNKEELTVVTLKQHNSTLSVNVDPVTSRVGTVFNISGNFVDANGTAIVGANLIIKVNNSYYNDSVVTGVDGYYSVNFTSTAEGNYTVTVIFNGDGVVNNTVNTTTLRADKIITNTTVRLVNNTQGNVTLAVNVTEVDGTPITSGTLKITIGEKSKEYSFNEIENIINLKDLGLNIDSTTPISANVLYVGDNIYINSTGKLAGSEEEFNQITADKESAIITVDVDPREVLIEKDYLIFGNLTDINGNIIEGAVVNITVKDSDGIIYSINVTANDNTGKFSYINNTLVAGTYTVNVSFYNDDYEYTSSEVVLIVNRINTTTEAYVSNNTAGNVTVHVVVSDTKGRDVSEGIVTIVNETGGVLGSATLDTSNNGVVDIVLESVQTNGTYTFIANYEGTGKYNSSSDDSSMADTKIVTRNVTIVASPENTTFGNTSVKVNLTDATTGNALNNAPFNVTLDGVVVGNGTTGNDGTIVVNVTVPVGEQVLTIVYPGNDTFNATNKTFTLTVEPRESVTVAEVTNFTAGNVTVKVNVTDATNSSPVTSGNITIIANGEEVAHVEFNDETGIVEVLTNITQSGDYEIVAIFEGNTNYTRSQDSGDDLNVNIDKRNATITYSVVNATVGNTTVNITVTDTVTGKPLINGTVNITLPDGTHVGSGVTDENGTAIINITVPITTTEIVVNYTGNITYNENVTTQNINMEQRNSTTSAKVTNNTAGNVTIEVIVTDATTGVNVPNGNVTIYSDGNIIGNGTVENGKVTVVTDINEIGTYDIVVAYEGNENYTGSSTTLNGEDIVGRESKITVNMTNTTYGNTTVNVTLVDPATNKPITNATIIVTLPNGTNITGTTNSNGTVNIPVDLPVGPNTLNVTYPGNETYNSTKTSISLTVEPRNSTTAGKIINNTVGNVTVKVNVTDATTGELVPNGYVQVFINNTVVGNGEISNGYANIPIIITELGVYDISIKYLGNENYTASNKTLPDEKIVGRQSNITATVPNATLGNTTVSVTVTDPITKEPVVNATVIVTLPNGTKINATTDKNGVVEIPVDLPVGSNAVNISYAGNKSFNGTNTTISVNVGKRDSNTQATIIDNNSSQDAIKVKVTDSITGKPVTSGLVTLTLDEKVVGKGKIDKNGIVTINTNVNNPGSYNYLVTYGGNENYTSSTDNVKSVIDKNTADIKVNVLDNKINNLTLQITVTDNETKPVVNGKVSVTLPNGTVITGKTNNKGVLNIKLDLPVGSNDVKVTLKENSLYKKATTTKTIKVEKIPIKITVKPVKGIIGEKITFEATITDINNKKVSGGNLVFKINGKTLRADGRFDSNEKPLKIKVENGVVKYTMTSQLYLRNSKYISASYSGSYSYAENESNINKVNIKLRTSTIKVTANKKVVKQGSNIKFKVIVKDTTKNSKKKSLIDKGHVIFKINGKTLKKNAKVIKVKVNNQKVVYTYLVPRGTSAVSDKKITKDYVVTAEYINTNYTKNVKNTTTYQVQPTDIKIKFQKVTLKNKKLSIKARIVDKNDKTVIGINKVCLKIDGKTYKKNGKTRFFRVKNGKINISKVKLSSAKIKSVTLVTGERQAYPNTKATTRKIARS